MQVLIYKTPNLFHLQPSGNIYPVLADAINPKAYDLSNLVRGRTGDREGQTMIQELQYIVENLIYHITEIMVSVRYKHDTDHDTNHDTGTSVYRGKSDLSYQRNHCKCAIQTRYRP
jgi:hypothetical protein